MKNYVLWWCAKLLLASCLAAPSVCSAAEAILLNVDSPIGPATQNYIENGLNFAATRKAELIIIQLDTPGGLSTAMHNIDKAILASIIPVATYVAPGGARAASAGTFILYASQIAAMAPGTNVGAASPVNLMAADTNKSTNAAEKIDQQNLSTLERKETNDAIANIKSMAQLHNRNADWAEQAVRNSVSLSATEALKAHVIDYVATDIPDLLKQINGSSVSVNGASKKLITTNLTVTAYQPDWRYKFLEIITDPNIAYILLLIGMYGLFFEFYHPGLILPGAAGTVSLLIALYAFQLLPINYVGFALVLLGIIFMIIEILISSFGVLGVAGIAAFVTGSILLLDINSPGYQIAWSLILMMTVLTVAYFLLIVSLSVQAMRAKVVTGREAIVGEEGEVLAFLNDFWQVRIGGEIWQAVSNEPLQLQQKIRVIAISGLILTVAPLNPSTTDRRPQHVRTL
ncbi:MAG: nodulation protein NfeD [Pseudomonadota bacterium]